VLDSVGVIQARFFEELLKVVLKRSCLVLAVTHGLCGMIGTGAIRSLIDAAVAVGCGLLVALIAPLLAGLGALLSTLDCYTERCFPAADHGWLKSCRLGTDGVMGGDAMPSLVVCSWGRRSTRGEVTKMLYHSCSVWSSLRVSSWGCTKTSSIHWACRSVGSACVVHAIRLPDGLAYVPRAQPVGLGAIAKFGRRS
jgi:hypothetical protein